jgi:hypothetical protein
MLRIICIMRQVLLGISECLTLFFNYVSIPLLLICYTISHIYLFIYVSLAMKEPAGSSETSVHLHQNALCHILEKNKLRGHHLGPLLCYTPSHKSICNVEAMILYTIKFQVRNRLVPIKDPKWLAWEAL